VRLAVRWTGFCHTAPAQVTVLPPVPVAEIVTAEDLGTS
jgi:hypothetical protein